MPLYEYRCRESREVFQRVAPMAESASPRICACGTVGDRIISPTRIARDFEAYECPVSGKMIEGRAAHEENLKVTGCRLYEPGETEAVRERSRMADRDLDRSLDNFVEREYEMMPSDKKEKLANELLSGADISVERTTA